MGLVEAALLFPAPLWWQHVLGLHFWTGSGTWPPVRGGALAMLMGGRPSRSSADQVLCFCRIIQDPSKELGCGNMKNPLQEY